MKKKKKVRIKYDRVFFTILGFFFIFLGIKKVALNKNNIIKMENIVSKNYNDVVKKYDFLDIDVTYEYDDNYDIDIVTKQSINVGEVIKKGDSLKIVVSLGKLDKEKLSNDKINELGRVPIMMYHGIVNKKNSDTNYTGGNVDSDGYTRTVEAFRNDLEFYYKNGYRMVKLSDYVNGDIDTPYGYSPIILTFDDGNQNNINVLGLDSNGDIIIDPNSAVGVLEEFKKKYSDYNVTAIFFVTNALFNQPEYNEKILHWLVDNGYEVGNHTRGHDNFSKIDTDKTQEVVGYMYQKLDMILGDKYSKIIALPFGSPYNKEHENYKYIISGTYNNYKYNTLAALRVGWEPEVSPYDIGFDKTFLKRCRAYDNNGLEFDIEMVFKGLEKNRYISDGRKDTVVISASNEDKVSKNMYKKIILY